MTSLDGLPHIVDLARRHVPDPLGVPAAPSDIDGVLDLLADVSGLAPVAGYITAGAEALCASPDGDDHFGLYGMSVRHLMAHNGVSDAVITADVFSMLAALHADQMIPHAVGPAPVAWWPTHRTPGGFDDLTEFHCWYDMPGANDETVSFDRLMVNGTWRGRAGVKTGDRLVGQPFPDFWPFLVDSPLLEYLRLSRIAGGLVELRRAGDRSARNRLIAARETQTSLAPVAVAWVGEALSRVRSARDFITTALES